MDAEYYKSRIWPHMFYMPEADIWRWQMNAARVMGNSLDRAYVPDLVKAFRENGDRRVRAMAAWALGRLGGPEAGAALESFIGECDGDVREEVQLAINSLNQQADRA
jgi:epoxyqueuosine reductase